MNMPLFNAWKKEDQDRAIINVQKRFIFILTLICLLLGIGWLLAPSQLRIYIPPDLSSGALIKPNEIPKPLIYSFAYQVWQEINDWPLNGEQDYSKAIRTYSAYLTPSFQDSLLQDYQNLKSLGQVQRQRSLQGLAAASYDPASVKVLSSTTWEVDLTMHLNEYKNNQPVKTIDILYPIKVTRMAISEQHNPYGLALAGFVREPERIKTLDTENRP